MWKLSDSGRTDDRFTVLLETSVRLVDIFIVIVVKCIEFIALSRTSITAAL